MLGLSKKGMGFFIYFLIEKQPQQKRILYNMVISVSSFMKYWHCANFFKVIFSSNAYATLNI